MDSLQFAAEDVILIFDGAVVEVFQTTYDRSFREPAAWVGVKVEPRKHDRVRFTVGRTEPAGQPLYGPDVDMSWTDIMFEFAATEEPQVRGFFQEVARASGRLGPP